MKKFTITSSSITNDGWRPDAVHEGIKSSDLLNFDYVVDGQILLETFDEAEAMQEFSKLHCDCIFTKTMTGNYSADIEYYELAIEDGELDDDRNFEGDGFVDVKVAPFWREIYTA